ncbi:MAG: chemotaxis protein CheX [Planctomycetota bacterium]
MPQSAIDQQIAEPSGQCAITIDNVNEMVGDLFTSMLGMQIDTTPREICEIKEDDILASIQINGDHRASVFVYTSLDLASVIGCAMFGQEPDEIEKADVLDALGEVVNVIGGNIKGVIDKECSLSLPCVGVSEGVCPSGDVHATYQLGGQPISVVILHR